MNNSVSIVFTPVFEQGPNENIAGKFEPVNICFGKEALSRRQAEFRYLVSSPQSHVYCPAIFKFLTFFIFFTSIFEKENATPAKTFDTSTIEELFGIFHIKHNGKDYQKTAFARRMRKIRERKNSLLKNR